ncbi:hypothetical protein ASG22_08095 [Chryseobacterium sp. Leaf405]|uniref:hypothetical protein n=1 Tax=Chryseobacterium sp. Leaf405 TaxID=1736367 RepID=UPI0006FE9C5B|nr:hypothetical protein [Chryseobacterium sp. Leaf405]KQT23975.1 hypothetical protein ASG22_08095 [Chryseobacterium sp. Leaf405]
MNKIKILFLLIVPVFSISGQSIRWKKLNKDVYYSQLEINSNEKVEIEDSVKVDLLTFDFNKKNKIKNKMQLNKSGYSYYDSYKNVKKNYIPVEFHDDLLKKSEYIFKIKTKGKNSYIISFAKDLNKDQLKHLVSYFNRKYILIQNDYSTKEDNIKKDEIWSKGSGVKIIHTIYTTLKITTVKEIDFNLVARRIKKNIITTSSYLSNKKNKTFYFRIKT